MPDAPVERIPIDPLETKPEALCLSGGGYRAMLFHVGVLWRLYEARLLQDVKRVSSVSGGSITAAVLVLGWRRLSFDPARLNSDFLPLVVSPIRAHCPHERTLALAETPTRLKRLDENIQERLINWGYAVCDAALRKHVDFQIKQPSGFPFPATGV